MLADAGRYLAPLTGLRFLAALHVVLFHLRDPYLVGAPLGLWTIAGQGETAVGLFFLLSGFVLAHTYMPAAGTVRISRRAFWAARFARIYPVYALSLLLALPDFLDLDRASRLKLVLVVPTMLQAWLPALAYQWNGLTWSLSTEAFFYLLFPVIAVPLARLRGRALAAAMATCWVLALAAPVLSQLLGLDRVWAGSVMQSARWMTYNPLLRLPEFALGVLLARLFLATRGPSRRRWVGPTLATLGATGLLAAFAITPFLPPPIVSNGLLAPIDGALLIGLALGGPGLAWLLSRRLLVLLGEASYAMYLLHGPLLGGIGRLVDARPQLQPYVQTTWFLGVFLIVLVGLSLLTFVVVERPARGALRRWLSNSPAHNSTAVASLTTLRGRSAG